MDKMDTKEMLKARGNRYGRFDGHAGVTWGLKREMKRSRQWDNLPDDMKEALDMIAHKIGRILNGDPEYDDSWRDIAGYATLIVQRLNKEGEYAEETILSTRSDSLDVPRDAGRADDSDDNIPDSKYPCHPRAEYNPNASFHLHQRHSKLSCPSLIQLVALFGEAQVISCRLAGESDWIEVSPSDRLDLKTWYTTENVFALPDVEELVLELSWNFFRIVLIWYRDFSTSVFIKG